MKLGRTLEWWSNGITQVSIYGFFITFMEHIYAFNIVLLQNIATLQFDKANIQKKKEEEKVILFFVWRFIPTHPPT